MNEAKSVVICICTYRRPRELGRLFESLDKLRFSEIAAPQVCIVVVDNNPLGDSRGVCDKYERLSPWPLRYAVEEKPGISHARNRCLSLVPDETEFVVFIDDDETVTADWLENLLSVQRRYCADVVAGPVLPVYETAAPAWMQSGEFHGFRGEMKWKTGCAIDEFATGNVLIARRFINKHGLKFDTDFGLTGGEDTLFSRTARKLGAKMIWCDEAVAHEYVPSTRTNVSWLLERSFCIGTTNSKTISLLEGRAKGLTMSFWRGLTRFGFGALSLPIAMVHGRASTVRTLCRAAYGLGCLVGSSGYKFQHYRREV